MSDVQKVLSFSGGRTSGYMLRREIDRIGIDEYRRQFITLFCNTGKEHDLTLDFVRDVETNWGVPITWLEYCRIPAIEIPLEAMQGRKRDNLEAQQQAGEFAHWFKVVNYETAAREHQRGPYDELLEWANVLPNVRTRMCSVQMKLRTMQRYLGSLGVFDYESYIGIRDDEWHRKTEIMVNITKGEHPEFPLINDRQTKDDVHRFWGSHAFTLNLPVVNGETIDGNCRRCFLKAAWKLVGVIREESTRKKRSLPPRGPEMGRFSRRGDPTLSLSK